MWVRAGGKARALLTALGMVLEVGTGFQLLFSEEDGFG